MGTRLVGRHKRLKRIISDLCEDMTWKSRILIVDNNANEWMHEFQVGKIGNQSYTQQDKIYQSIYASKTCYKPWTWWGKRAYLYPNAIFTWTASFVLDW